MAEIQGRHTPSLVPAFAAENPSDVAVVAASKLRRLYLSHFDIILGPGSLGISLMSVVG